MQQFRFLGENSRSYEEIWRFQKERVEAIAKGQAEEALIFCEHEEVITAGRRYREENLLQKDAKIFFIERGGDLTWHGPGQLVIYPLLKLNGSIFQHGLSEYLRFCEDWVIDVLSGYSLEAGRFGPTGVWLRSEPEAPPRKIASIGVAVRRWVTYHGIALNVSNDLLAFEKIRPCNFDASVMTSLEKEGIHCSLEDLIESFLDSFSRLRPGTAELRRSHIA
ncbi:MAG: lipoyl(octanoyl) transferase LipB [Bradymonadales bacterium]|nr:MAG: lipoyl(octanoyl) transferase LipB [Bradymonadales bacterium]